MIAQKTILLVEDETEIRKMLKIFLDVEDFNVVEAVTGNDALSKVAAVRPDLVVLDLGLPDIDGQEIIQIVRQFSNTPIIVLSARLDDKEVVRALHAGADDYVTKPFRAENLLARKNANFRNKTVEAVEPFLENGPITMDLQRYEVLLDGTLVSFTPKEFSLLRLFVQNKGRIMSHKHILREVWGPAHTDDMQYLRVYIGQIRMKLDAINGLGRSIKSASRLGYLMTALPSAAAKQVAAA